MEKEKVRMPAGALVACILIIAFLLALITGGVLWAKSSRTNPFDPNASSGEPSLTAPAEAEAHDGGAAQDPAGQATPEPVDNTDRPSGSIDFEGQPIDNTGRAQEDIIEDCLNAVVSIDITMSSGYNDVYAGSGSGVIISDDGYIVTCNHVVEGASTIMVYLNDGTEHDATLIGADSVTDIAVVKIEGTGYDYATLGSSSDLRIGNRVYAIGNALGELSNTVTDGIISGIDREIEIEKQKMTVLQTSAAINSGNSGGALFLASGELIGIVNAKSSGTTSGGATIEGLAFAVPIDTAKPIIADLMDYGFVQGRPFLGVATRDNSYSSGWFSYETYPIVVSVIEGSSADIAGIQVNDIITAIDGKPISGTTELRATVNTYKIGDTITVTVTRGNTTLDIVVTLLERTSA